MYHGFGDLCGPLSRLVKGESVQIEVINVADLGKYQGYRRLVTVTMTPP